MNIRAVFPVEYDQLDAMPAPDHEHFSRGGEFLGLLRDFIKCKAPNGEHVIWGTPERVSLAVDDLERLAERIALAGARHYLDKMKSEASSCEQFAQWPGNLVDPGVPNVPRGWEVYAIGDGYGYRSFDRPRNPKQDLAREDAEDINIVIGQCWRAAQRRWNEYQTLQYRCGTAKSIRANELLVAWFNDSIAGVTQSVLNLAQLSNKLAAVYGIKSIPMAAISQLQHFTIHLATFDWDCIEESERDAAKVEGSITYADVVLRDMVGRMTTKSVEGAPADVQ